MTHSQNASTHDIAELIEAASKAAGSQNKLAALLDTTAPTLIQIYQARVKAWGMRGRCLAAVACEGAGATWRHAYQVELQEAWGRRAGGLGGLVRGVRGACEAGHGA